MQKIRKILFYMGLAFFCSIGMLFVAIFIFFPYNETDTCLSDGYCPEGFQFDACGGAFDGCIVTEDACTGRGKWYPKERYCKFNSPESQAYQCLKRGICPNGYWLQTSIVYNNEHLYQITFENCESIGTWNAKDNSCYLDRDVLEEILKAYQIAGQKDPRTRYLLEIAR